MKFAIAAFGIFFPLVTLAHHSLAYYDRTTVRELAGEVTRVNWRNPHVFIFLRVEGVEWEIESQPANMLTRWQFPRDAFQVGQEVRVAGRAASNGEPKLRLRNVLLPDGTEALLAANAQPRWSDRAVQFNASTATITNAEVTEAISPGIFRVWSRTRKEGIIVSFVRWPLELPLTSAAQSVYSQWDRSQDTALQCEPPGMPRAVASNPFAVQFVDRGTVIELRLEEFDQLRTIRLPGAVIDEDPPSTPLGYSTGYWENDTTLVVNTTAIDYPIFNQAGVPLSGSAEIVERFSLSENRARLNYEITVTDPEIFTQPVTGTKYWDWIPGDEILPYNCGAG